MAYAMPDDEAYATPPGYLASRFDDQCCNLDCGACELRRAKDLAVSVREIRLSRIASGVHSRIKRDDSSYIDNLLEG